MSTRRKLAQGWFGLSLVIVGALLLPGTQATSQEQEKNSEPAAEATDAPAPADAPSAAAPPAEAPAAEAAPAADAPKTEAPAAEAPKTEEAPAESAAESKAPAVEAAPAAATTSTADSEASKDAPSSTSALPAGKSDDPLAKKAADAVAAQTGEPADGMNIWLLMAILLAVFILPMVLGNYLARIWKMPDHGWKFSLVLLALFASTFILWFGRFKYGPDLAGGITLVYELADLPQAQAAAKKAPADPSEDGKQQIQSGGREFTMDKLIGALKKRLDPDGTKEITIREYGPAVEIIIPQVGPDEMEFVKRRITDLGQLEFRITADPDRPEDRALIEAARRLPPSQKALLDGETKLAEWIAYDTNEFGQVLPVAEQHMVATRMAGDTPEALVKMDRWNVTGDYLTSATKGLSDTGGPAVNFAFNREGARRFSNFTSENRPNTATGARRYLGIVLDKKLISAPSINDVISDRGMISGQNMRDKEVEHIVEILNAGSLPAALAKQPISEAIISPTLGKTTVDAGKRAIAWSMIAVVVFMLIYYRFAGIVACIALTLNLVLVLALMVLIQAAFTLPGLAGLALTIGMAVDANILIYERLREELKQGTALRMAIRNGFSRALGAIIDSNVTTIITGIVLFYLGTDQVRGFAITLILGLLTSMFTAIFVARVIFDVAERRGWITTLRMMKLMTTPNYDFLRVRWAAIGISAVIIAIGAGAAYNRGANFFDVDFTGGSSVNFTLAEPMSITDVTAKLEESDLSDKNLLVVAREAAGGGLRDTRYSIDTNLKSVDDVKKSLIQIFGDNLQRYSFEFKDLAPYKEGDVDGAQAKILVNSGKGFTDDDGLSHDALRDLLRNVLTASGHTGVEPTVSNPKYQRGSGARFKEWDVRFVGLDASATQAVLEKLQSQMQTTPLFPMASTIGGRVSESMQQSALLAVFVSLLAVVVYLWLRFQKASFGMAATAAAFHDVLVAIACMAISAYIVRAAPGLASFLKLEAFQINLTIIAALLTIIGYSLNDTIVTFDRLREIKGKSPKMTPQMVNSSVNQTLSRTVLTATTVLMVCIIMYVFGGEGIHGFAFAFMVGTIAGSYSTIFIAAPVLLWLSGESASTTAPTRASEPTGARAATR